MTDYQILVNLNRRSLILQDKIRSDFVDIGFNDFNGNMLLNYWMKSDKCNVINTKVWIIVLIIALSFIKTMYFLYRDLDATS
ncbi:Uncharacterized protein Nst1_521 [Candidatus Nanobsidianus stetteri]|uniref:Uncharacterized protein n=1 Tax=Nanobsidianus stetteri TaxID=1294122 RepID=R1G2Q8_NANST|nr:Uncharacterized protein Nst1_521 [Candidatus Nanobsidianus stetteri]